MDIFKGWLLLYLVGSMPVLAFYAAGLSGWFFDYPLGLFGGIFVVLAIPLVLLVLKVPSAPAWNIAGLWTGSGLILVRIAYGVLQMPRPLEFSEARIMATIVIAALTWSVIWTWYFLVSERIARSFA